MRYIFLLLPALLGGRAVLAQTSSSSSSSSSSTNSASNSYTPGWGTLNYAIPESPAFKLLGTDPSNILRPTSIRSAALSLGNYLLDSGTIIPKNLAVEFSPFSFGNLSLHDYNQSAFKRFIYRTRFSVGTVVGSNGSYSIAEGIRLTLKDETDLATVPELNRLLGQMAITEAQCQDDAINQYIQKNRPQGVSVNVFRDKVVAQLKTDTTVQNAVATLASQIQKQKYQTALDSLTKVRNTKADSLWNRPIIQLGLAASELSKDSLIKNASVNKVALYATAGLPLGKNGQMLIGVSEQGIDSGNCWYNNLSLGGRAYLGENDVKGYAEFQFTNVHGNNAFYAALGVEFSIGSGIWGDFTAGLNQAANGRVAFVPGFKISYGTLASKKTISK